MTQDKDYLAGGSQAARSGSEVGARPTSPGELLPCPFCGGKARYEHQLQRSGYGEYETHQYTHLVVCSVCRAHGRDVGQQPLSHRTSHSAADFRADPILLANTQNEYDGYCAGLKAEAISAWNVRVTGEPQ